MSSGYAKDCAYSLGHGWQRLFKTNILVVDFEKYSIIKENRIFVATIIMDIEDFDNETREILAKKFIEEVILPQWKQLRQWKEVTKQTPQIDFGYLAQHLVSIISGIRGTGQRGKGDDLSDGSEIKSASCLDAEDTPRWNNVNCGKKTERELLEILNNTPYFFFVLIDTTERFGDILRCRVWCIRPKEDTNFRNVILGWGKDNRTKSRTNLQLHPPRWDKAEENITTNTYGNLKLPLLYYSKQVDIPEILVMETKFFDPNVIILGLSEAVERN